MPPNTDTREISGHSQPLTVRPAGERGHARHGWLDSRHTFSFANYYDPRHMGFRALRVINDDRVAGGAGFPAHPHRDMEIISYVVEGALEHRDSMGHGSVIHPGEVQIMSAGRGVMHSEFNHSRSDRLRFLQIWIEPRERGLEPSYDQRDFGDERRGKLRLVASPTGEDGSVLIHQDARLYASLLRGGERVRYEVQDSRHVWIQVVDGDVRVGERELGPGDGASTTGAQTLELHAASDANLLLFDLS